jgi:hypothetical protein
VGKWLKQRAYALQEEELEDDDEWSHEDSISKPDKRKLCAKWLVQAWRELKADHQLDLVSSQHVQRFR